MISDESSSSLGFTPRRQVDFEVHSFPHIHTPFHNLRVLICELKIAFVPEHYFATFLFPSLQMFEFKPLTRPRQKSRGVWNFYRENFQKHGWDHLPITKEFQERYVLPPLLVEHIFNNPTFTKFMPQSRVLSQNDFFLALLYRLNTGCEFTTLEDVFGGDKNTHSSMFNKMLNSGVLFFKNCIKMPNREQCKQKKKMFEAQGFPNPEALWVGDCFDTPIHSNNMNYYTNKQCCPSKHAIRVCT